MKIPGAYPGGSKVADLMVCFIGFNGMFRGNYWEVNGISMDFIRILSDFHGIS